MTADYHVTLCLDNGRSIDAFASTASAAGKNLPVEKLGDAVAGSPDSFTVPQDCVITDAFFESASGAIELIRDGSNTGVVLRAAHNQASQAGRKRHNIGLAANCVYRIKVVSDFPA